MNHAPRRPQDGPTEDEIAAVLTALIRRDAEPESSGYERWRRVRLAAQERTGRDGDVQPRR